MRSFLLATLLGSLVTPAAAQYLVRDIRLPTSGSGSSSVRDIVDFGGIAIFAATQDHGVELWRSDGTPSGTYMLKDINPGSASSNPTNLVVAGNYVFFQATLPGIGNELWRTDGTAAGTILLRDFAAGDASSSLNGLTAYQGKLWFSAVDGSASPSPGYELWSSDGTVAGTQVFADLHPGLSSSSPSQLAVGAGYLFFSAATPSAGRELMRTDGTLAGTVLVKDAAPGTASSSITSAVGVPNGVYYLCNDNSGSGSELWFSDGTTAGTALVRDIRPGSASTPILEMTAFENRLLFNADDGTGLGSEPWCSDGTAAGTQPLGDVAPGTASSSAGNFVPLATNLALFVASDGTNGYELWRTDGTAAGTSIVNLYGTTSSYPQYLARLGNEVFFSALTPTLGRELHATDGTLSGTRLVYDSPTTSGTPQQLAKVGSRIFMRNYGPLGSELYVTDGTTAGTNLVADIAPALGDSTPAEFVGLAGKTIFSATETGGIQVAFASDGTGNGTIQLGPQAYPSNLCRLGNEIWYVATVSGIGSELFRTDGTPAGTGLGVDVRVGPTSSNPTNLTSLHGKLWFAASDTGFGSEPYVSDGTPAGTMRLADIAPGTTGSNAAKFTPISGGRVLFTAYEPNTGIELYVSDGTTLGTQLVADIHTGTGSSSITDLTPVGNLCYFLATSPTAGTELYVTDGTAAGTTVAVDLTPGAGSSNPSQLRALASGLLLYVAYQPGLGYELYRSNGTPAGTSMIAEILPSTTNALIQDLTVSGNVAFFTADDVAHGRELYWTDGYALGMVKDIYPGAPNGVIAGSLRARGSSGQALFAACDGGDGLQVWGSDGTALGTHQIGKLGPWAGSGAVRLGDFTTIGTETWFAADDGITGLEPWLISVTGISAATATYGNGCAGSTPLVPQLTANGLPRLANASFGLQLANARPFALAAGNLAFSPSNVPFGACRLLLGQPIATMPATFTNASGMAAVPFPIPAAPAFAGLSFYGQFLVFDAGGALLGLGALSNGLSFTIGN